MLQPDEFFKKYEGIKIENYKIIIEYNGQDITISKGFPRIPDNGIIWKKETNYLVNFDILGIGLNHIIEVDLKGSEIVLLGKGQSIINDAIKKVKGGIKNKEIFEELVKLYFKDAIRKAKKKGEVVSCFIGWNKMVRYNKHNEIKSEKWCFMPLVDNEINPEADGYNENTMFYALNDDAEIDFLEQINSLTLFLEKKENWILFLTTIHAISQFHIFLPIKKKIIKKKNVEMKDEIDIDEEMDYNIEKSNATNNMQMNCRKRISTAVCYSDKYESFAKKMLNLFCNFSDIKSFNTLTEGLGTICVNSQDIKEKNVYSDIPLIIYGKPSVLSTASSFVRLIERRQNKNKMSMSPVYFTDKPFGKKTILNIIYNDSLQFENREIEEKKIKAARRGYIELIYKYLCFLTGVYNVNIDVEEEFWAGSIKLSSGVAQRIIAKIKEGGLFEDTIQPYENEILSIYEELYLAAEIWCIFLRIIRDEYNPQERQAIEKLRKMFGYHIREQRLRKPSSVFGGEEKTKLQKEDYCVYFVNFVKDLIRKGDNESFIKERSKKNPNQSLLRADNNTWENMFEAYCNNNNISTLQPSDISKLLESLAEKNIIIRPRDGAYKEKVFKINDKKRVSALIINRNTIESFD